MTPALPGSPDTPGAGKYPAPLVTNPAQILDRSEMWAAQFVNRSDTLCHSRPQRSSRSRPPLLIGEEPIQTAAAQMVRLACQQPIRAVTDCLGHTRKLIKKG